MNNILKTALCFAVAISATFSIFYWDRQIPAHMSAWYAELKELPQPAWWVLPANLTNAIGTSVLALVIIVAIVSYEKKN